MCEQISWFFVESRSEFFRADQGSPSTAATAAPEFLFHIARQSGRAIHVFAILHNSFDHDGDSARTCDAKIRYAISVASRFCTHGRAKNTRARR